MSISFVVLGMVSVYIMSMTGIAMVMPTMVVTMAMASMRMIVSMMAECDHQNNVHAKSNARNYEHDFAVYICIRVDKTHDGFIDQDARDQPYDLDRQKSPKNLRSVVSKCLARVRFPT